MDEYQKSNLEMKRVRMEEFWKEVGLLDMEGTYALALGREADSEYTIFSKDNKSVGFSISSKDSSRLSGLAVHQDYRGRGLGKEIVNYLKCNAKENGNHLTVCSMPASYGFFQNCGLKISEHEPGEVWMIDEN